jgi:PHD/YefM family antitoxin component YafN of YafNO toxin-antitoxin module
MTKIVSTREAGERLLELLESVAGGDEVVIERQGEPEFVILRAADVAELRDMQQRWEAFERLEAVRERVRARNQELTDEQAEDLADRAAHDAIDSLAERGVLRFERDRRP